MLTLILANAFIEVRFDINQIASRGYKLIVNDGKPRLYLLASELASHDAQEFFTSFAFAVSTFTTER